MFSQNYTLHTYELALVNVNISAVTYFSTMGNFHSLALYNEHNKQYMVQVITSVNVKFPIF